MIEIKDYTSKNPDGTIVEVLSFALNYLGLDNIKVVAVGNAPLLKRLSTKDTDFEAMLMPSGLEHSYVLYIADVNKSELYRILCHEAVHLLQMESGDLVVDTCTFGCTWKGMRYDKSYPYQERPWEQEAFRVQNTILKKYKKSIKTKKS